MKSDRISAAAAPNKFMKALCLLTTSFAAAMSLSAAPTVSRERLHTFQEEDVLGSSFEMRVLAASPDGASRAETAALDEIARERAILSSWDADSEFSRWFGMR